MPVRDGRVSRAAAGAPLAPLAPLDWAAMTLLDGLLVELAGAHLAQ
jgi:hypothetical protein